MDKLAVYIDFDKTIAPVHGFSFPPLPEVIEALNTIATKFRIIIYSSRANMSVCNETDYLELLDYLAKHQIKYDAIHDRKPLYVAIIDDRSFNPTKESWQSITSSIMTE